MTCSVDSTAPQMTSVFERYLTVWVGLCIVAGILLGRFAPDLAKALYGMAIVVNDAPVVSIPMVMVAINSPTMLLLYGVLGGRLLDLNEMPVPWEALLLSVGIYVALPLVAGYLSRRWIIQTQGEVWFQEKFLHVLTPVSIAALLLTLVLLFSFKGDIIVAQPLTFRWIAIPLFV